MAQFYVNFMNFRKVIDRSKIDVLRQKKTKFRWWIDLIKKLFFFIVVSAITFFVVTIGYLKNNSYQAQTNNQNNVTETIEKSSKDYNLVFYKKHCPYCEGAASEVINFAEEIKLANMVQD